MSVSRTVMAASTIAVAALALGMSPYMKAFNDQYKPKKDSEIAKATCATCHVGKTKKLNPYGEDLKEAMAKEKTKKMSAELLKQVEKLDSDKDGVLNGKEIEKDTLPGDPKSK